MVGFIDISGRTIKLNGPMTVMDLVLHAWGWGRGGGRFLEYGGAFLKLAVF